MGMEATFITIHDLTDDATLLYTSDSVVDVLGYTPAELVNRSAWDFFSRDELPYARDFHQQRVASDKAAVLAYCSIRDKRGDWVGCECCFTIVYDVMIACTSVYKRGLRSQRRAEEAPVVRRIFSSSPNDPRYHMLSHLSEKFSQPSKWHQHEPRAALFLNRFTRTLTIMYATAGLQEVIGIPAETMRGRSFYYCISASCLQDAVKCLENAKGNDSIAYLRFWFRDPRIDDDPSPAVATESSDDEMTTTTTTTTTTTDMSDDGGVHFHTGGHATRGESMDVDSDESGLASRNSSGDSTRRPETHESIFGQARLEESSASSLAHSLSPEGRRSTTSPPALASEPIELEAVISCTSDGLVVCLRRARPLIPHPAQPPSRPVHRNGLFAAPWATEPVFPSVSARSRGHSTTYAPSLGPHCARRASAASPPRPADRDRSDFMNAIRDQAIFAWALTGINGSLARFGMGKPRGDSLPQDGLPIWASDADAEHVSAEDSGGGESRWDRADGRPGTNIFGDPGLDRFGSTSTSRSHTGTGTTPPRGS